ncbi:MAG: LD-carboxypeptidase [Firmicutes bacterium]|nr:LD-carboxypeptidase [Bacillota bacterium]
MKFPKKLQKGDTIGLVAPSSPIPPERVQPCIDKIRELGYQVKVADNLAENFHGFTAGTARTRAEWINRMFLDPEVDAVFCVRGGDGSYQIMEYLDLEAIKAHPKLFLGYSDITNLHTVFNGICEFGTLHGPMVHSNMIDHFDEETARSFFEILNGEGEIEFWNPAGKELETVTPGKASGVLAGGNLTLLSDAIGTPYALDPTGKILFLEEVHGSSSGFERDMFALRNAGYFHKAAGVLMGQFTEMKSDYDDDWTWHECMQDLFKDLDIPVLAGIESGHEFPMLTLPMGAFCEMDATERTIRFRMER